MIVKLKRKYTCHKIVKKTRAVGDHNQKAQKKKGGPKTYVYGSRVLLIRNPLKGSAIMVDREDV